MSKQAATYVTDEQHTRWKSNADGRDMSFSAWLEAMVEAGMKKFEPRVTPTESVTDLQEQRSDLRSELEQARERISHLETQLYSGEQQAIIDHLKKNDGAALGELVQMSIERSPERIHSNLDQLGTDVTHENETYYYVGDR